MEQWYMFLSFFQTGAEDRSTHRACLKTWRIPWQNSRKTCPSTSTTRTSPLRILVLLPVTSFVAYSSPTCHSASTNVSTFTSDTIWLRIVARKDSMPARRDLKWLLVAEHNFKSLRKICTLGWMSRNSYQYS